MVAITPSALLPVLRKLQQRDTFATDEIEAILKLPIRIAQVDARTQLVREGDLPEYCCVLLSGLAARHKSAQDGSRQILAIQFRGDILGLNYGLLQEADHGVQSLTRAEVGFIAHQAVLDLASAYPQIGRALWRETLVEASVAREWITNVGQRNARQRIAHLLCEVALRHEGESVRDERGIEWPLTQEQLGEATGLTSVHVNRTLQGLRETGLIRTTRGTVTILDWTGLQDAGDFNRAYLHLPATRPVAARPNFAHA